MTAKQLKSMDVWELLDQRAEIDAALAEKRRELETGRTRSRRSKVRTTARRRAAPTARRAD